MPQLHAYALFVYGAVALLAVIKPVASQQPGFVCKPPVAHGGTSGTERAGHHLEGSSVKPPEMWVLSLALLQMLLSSSLLQMSLGQAACGLPTVLFFVPEHSTGLANSRSFLDYDYDPEINSRLKLFWSSDQLELSR